MYYTSSMKQNMRKFNRNFNKSNDCFVMSVSKKCVLQKNCPTIDSDN